MNFIRSHLVIHNRFLALISPSKLIRFFLLFDLFFVLILSYSVAVAYMTFIFFCDIFQWSVCLSMLAMQRYMYAQYVNWTLSYEFLEAGLSMTLMCKLLCWLFKCGLFASLKLRYEFLFVNIEIFLRYIFNRPDVILFRIRPLRWPSTKTKDLKETGVTFRSPGLV